MFEKYGFESAYIAIQVSISCVYILAEICFWRVFVPSFQTKLNLKMMLFHATESFKN
jgi:hypothetical protein